MARRQWKHASHCASIWYRSNARTFGGAYALCAIALSIALSTRIFAALGPSIGRGTVPSSRHLLGCLTTFVQLDPKQHKRGIVMDPHFKYSAVNDHLVEQAGFTVSHEAVRLFPLS